MWQALLSSWKLTLSFIAILLIVLSAGYIYVTILQGNQRRALDTQKSQLVASCRQAQATTEKANDKLAADNHNLTSRLNTLLLQHPAQCVPVAKSAGQTGNGAGYAGPNVSSAWLYGFAADCEKYRETVMVLQDFIADERK